MKLTMVGTGYVGLVTGACLANTGNTVICLDVDRQKIDRLNDGHIPIFEPGLEPLIVRNREAGRLLFTTDKELAYQDAEAIFICVGTPADEDGSADLQHVLAVAADIADALEQLGPQARPKLVVVKSTVPVGTTDKVRDLIRSRTGVPFYIADNPEFLKEGAAVSDFQRPDRVICGVEQAEAGEVLRDLYEPFVRQGNPIILTDVRSAEMIKYASNAMLACKISFINEIARLCEHCGADVKSVRDGMCSDRRIGKHFLFPGLGYGGSCFPKDTRAVIGMGRALGFECQLTQAVHDVNQAQRDYFWNKILDHFENRVDGCTLAFWGISFKPETDDVREAPSVSLMQKAIEAGARVRAYDPAASETGLRAVPDAAIVNDPYETLHGCDALVICTEWSEFRNPDFERIGATLKQRVIFDGRNIYRRRLMQRHRFTYYSIGRPPVHQQAAAATP